MSDAILVINPGSSSLKYQLFDYQTLALIKGDDIGHIGEKGSPFQNHDMAFQTMFNDIKQQNDTNIVGVGHRIVYGDPSIKSSVIIDDSVKAVVKKMAQVAPLHNPAALTGIEMAEQYFKYIPQIGVFDTAMHQTISEENYTYAIPKKISEEYGIRKLGFHGTSVRYVLIKAKLMLDKAQDTGNYIIVHYGSGASVTAIKDDKSVDNSMGFTPTAGLIMGTRSGDIGTGVIPYLLKRGIPLAEIDNMLNKESGIKGLTGNNDFREVEKNRFDCKDNTLTWKMIVSSIQKYIGAYLSKLKYNINGLIFTGGGGENSYELRKDVCKNFERVGIRINENLNKGRNGKESRIDLGWGDVPIFCIPTDENFVIASDVRAIIENGKQPLNMDTLNKILLHNMKQRNL